MFKVVTINIFSDLTLWEQRRSLLLTQLRDLQPDFIAVQEASLPVNNAGWLASGLELPHLFLSPKSGKAGKKEGIAILSRLPFQARDTLVLGSQDRVAQYVRVQLGSQALIIANTHLYWQPGDSQARLAQVERLLDWLPDDLPCVVCGDFNATPDSLSIRRMQQDFTSAYAAVHGQEPDYTTPTPLPRSTLLLLRTAAHFWSNLRLRELSLDWKGTLDYIFTNDRLHVQESRVVLNQPDPQDERIYPSDHFGLYASMEVT